ncbi:hypothetical protein SELMODRAFT_413186 [Selaginella moellendorffii]|uniref:Uncharacterized protein n=1 Tax=Selaginella moellendorffii TaxID=88036 RepID=D8RNM1_SELML|nr:hypothetical protein SELMODRAFT_413186 [Selaginella moellendorffii]
MKHVALHIGKRRQVKIGVFIFLWHIYEHYTSQKNPMPFLTPPLISPLREIARDMQTSQNPNDMDSNQKQIHDSPTSIETTPMPMQISSSIGEVMSTQTDNTRPQISTHDVPIDATKLLAIDTTNKSTYASDSDTLSANQYSEMRQPQQQQMLQQHYKVKVLSYIKIITKKVDGGIALKVVIGLNLDLALAIDGCSLYLGTM